MKTQLQGFLYNLLLTAIRPLQLLRAGMLSVMLICAIASPSRAGIIATRADLDALLNVAETVENFERYSLPPSGVEQLRTPSGTFAQTLDATSIVNDQGPGLIVVGLVLNSIGGINQFQWQGPAWFGQPSKDIESFDPIAFDFLGGTTAAGFDFGAFTAETYTITLYGPDRRTVVQSFVQTLGRGTPEMGFFGFYNPGGIGRITASAPNGIIVDNVAFGNADKALTASPEPRSFTTLFFGIVALAATTHARRAMVRSPRKTSPLTAVNGQS